MSTAVTPAINENDSTISHYIGEISPCRYCKSNQLRAAGLANQVTHCRFCLSSGWVAECMKCEGTGKVTAGSVWDGGKSGYTSTCNICGGVGTIPSREPKEKVKPSPLPLAKEEKLVAAPSIPEEVFEALVKEEKKAEEAPQVASQAPPSQSSSPSPSHHHKGKKAEEK